MKEKYRNVLYDYYTIYPSEYDYIIDGNKLYKWDGSILMVGSFNDLIDYALSSGNVKILINKGNYSVTRTIKLPSNTTLVLNNAVLKLAYRVNKSMFENIDQENGNSNISIYGGVLDGNADENIYTSVITLMNCSNVKIIGTTINHTWSVAVWLRGNSSNIEISINVGVYADTGVFMSGVLDNIYIHDCVMNDIGYEGVSSDSVDEYKISVNNLVITRLYINSYRYGIYLYVDDPPEGYKSSNISITNNTIIAKIRDGIRIIGYYDNPSDGIYINGNKLFTYNAIWITNTKNVTITNNHIVGDNRGITAIYIDNGIVSNNKIKADRVFNTDGCKLLISNNYSELIENNYYAEFISDRDSNLVVTDNVIVNLKNVLKLSYGSHSNILFMNNKLIYNLEPKDMTLVNSDVYSQPYPVVYAYSNDLTDCTTLKSGNVELKLKNNIGKLSENSGSATIQSGNSSVTVQHGLALTPTKVLATPTANIPIWITNIGEETFTINTSDPVTSDTVIYWYAET